MGKKMLGRREMAVLLYNMQPNYFTPFTSLHSIQQEQWCREADEHLGLFYAHMATLGWKMMPQEMTFEMRPSLPPPEAVKPIYRYAYDHAPEPTEDE